MLQAARRRPVVPCCAARAQCQHRRHASASAVNGYASPPLDAMAPDVNSLSAVTEWGVPPRHSIAAYLKDNRDHGFPHRWLGADAAAFAALPSAPLDPPPLPSDGLRAALAALAAERNTADAAVSAAKRALLEARGSSRALHEQGLSSVAEQQGQGLLAAFWSQAKATSDMQWREADAEDDVADARAALDAIDAKIWTEAHLTALPPAQPEQLLNAAVWECLDAAQPSLPLASALFGAGPPAAVTGEVLSRFFNLAFLRRPSLLISWAELTDYTTDLERRGDRLVAGLGTEAEQEEQMRPLAVYQQCIEAWEVAGVGSVTPVDAADDGEEAAQRAAALERLWAKYKRVAVGHFNQSELLAA